MICIGYPFTGHTLRLKVNKKKYVYIINLFYENDIKFYTPKFFSCKYIARQKSGK